MTKMILIGTFGKRLKDIDSVFKKYATKDKN